MPAGAYNFPTRTPMVRLRLVALRTCRKVVPVPFTPSHLSSYSNVDEFEVCIRVRPSGATMKTGASILRNLTRGWLTVPNTPHYHEIRPAYNPRLISFIAAVSWSLATTRRTPGTSVRYLPGQASWVASGHALSLRGIPSLTETVSQK